MAPGMPPGGVAGHGWPWRPLDRASAQTPGPAREGKIYWRLIRAGRCRRWWLLVLVLVLLVVGPAGPDSAAVALRKLK